MSSDDGTLRSRPPEARLLNREAAASFLGISERMFDRLVKYNQLLEPMRLGRRCLWDRKILDLWADLQSEHLKKPPEPFDWFGNIQS